MTFPESNQYENIVSANASVSTGITGLARRKEPSSESPPTRLEAKESLLQGNLRQCQGTQARPQADALLSRLRPSGDSASNGSGTLDTRRCPRCTSPNAILKGACLLCGWSNEPELEPLAYSLRGPKYGRTSRRLVEFPSINQRAWRSLPGARS